MSATDCYVSFPLYHGTSSHYISMFKCGTSPSGWPHTEIALKLLRRTWDELSKYGQSPEWYIDRILEQSSGNSNWQHGQLYVTPSIKSATRYACSGARSGGELLTLCSEALNKLAKYDLRLTKCLIEGAGSVQPFLRNDGLPPLIIELDSVRVTDLLPERESDDPLVMLATLKSLEPEMRGILGQQYNFRLANGAGSVAHVFEVKLQDGDHCLVKLA